MNLNQLARETAENICIKSGLYQRAAVHPPNYDHVTQRVLSALSAVAAEKNKECEALRKERDAEQAWHERFKRQNEELREERDTALASNAALREALEKLRRCDCGVAEEQRRTGRVGGFIPSHSKDCASSIAVAAFSTPAPPIVRRDVLEELHVATLDSRCSCHNEPEGDDCDFCIRRASAHDAARAELDRTKPTP